MSVIEMIYKAVVFTVMSGFVLLSAAGFVPQGREAAIPAQYAAP